MEEQFFAITETLSVVIHSLYALLNVSAGMEDPCSDPVVEQMTHLWVNTIQGRSLLDALALLLVGSIALKAEWKKALAEQGEHNNLPVYATIPEITVN